MLVLGQRFWFLHGLYWSINFFLTAVCLPLGHHRGDSLTHPMLITAFYIFDPKVIGSLVTRFGSLSPAERLLWCEPGTFRFLLQRFNPKLSFVSWFHVFMLLSCIFKQFFVPRVDVNRGEVRVQISDVESTLSMAQWVWMAPLRRN